MVDQQPDPNSPKPDKPAAPAKNPAPAKNAAPAKAVPAKVAAPKVETPKTPEVKTDVKILDEIPAGSPQWFRTHYDKAKNEVKTLRAELEKVKAAPPTAEDPEKGQIKETLAQREKRLSELEDEIRFVDYTKSNEYKTRYHEPYVAAWQNAVAEISSLTVKNADGTERAATAKDFEALMSIPNSNDALRAAGELFGDPAKASFALTQMGTVKQHIRTAQQAIHEFRTKGTERIKQQEADRERAGQEATKRWRQTTEEMIDGNPEIYQPEDGDEEGNTLLTKGFERADAAFGGMITGDDGKKRPPTPEEMITINAEIRNKAAAFDRLQHRYTKNLSRIAELEQQIAEYEKSGPGGGSPPGGERPTDENSFDAAVDRLAAR